MISRRRELVRKQEEREYQQMLGSSIKRRQSNAEAEGLQDVRRMLSLVLNLVLSILGLAVAIWVWMRNQAVEIVKIIHLLARIEN